MSLRPLRAAVETWKPGKSISADPLHRIATAWSEIVGRNVAAHSEPIEFTGSTLLVATGSSAWSQQLQFLSPTILGAIAALPETPDVKRLAFRTGLRRTSRNSASEGSSTRVDAIALPNRAPVVNDPLTPDTTGDAADALERLRLRFGTSRRSAAGACPACGAPVADATRTEPCAPCAVEADRKRQTEIARLIYMTPWLGLADLREHVPDLSGAEFESARRVLLQRWWLMLERARRARKLSASGIERHVASSYVLLHTRIPPDRITPAVVTNLLGEELVALVWPAEGVVDRGGRSGSSNKPVR